MTKGWIPAHRSLFEQDHHWLAPDKRHPAGKREAWLDLCQMAQHDEYQHGRHRLKRGEVMVSLTKMEERWAWSKKRVRGFMERLISDTMVGIVEGTPRGTIYRIVNYDTYAVRTDDEGHTEGQDEGHPKGTAGAPEQQLTTNNTTTSSDFETVWEVCRRGSKKKALGQYRKAVPSKVDHETLLSRWRAHVSAASAPEYVKHLERWIRDERWEEDLPTPPKARERKRVSTGAGYIEL